MKVLVNITLKEFRPGEWIECEAVKFLEAADGSFDVLMLGKPAPVETESEAAW